MKEKGGGNARGGRGETQCGGEKDRQPPLSTPIGKQTNSKKGKPPGKKHQIRGRREIEKTGSEVIGWEELNKRGWGKQKKRRKKKSSKKGGACQLKLNRPNPQSRKGKKSRGKKSMHTRPPW